MERLTDEQRDDLCSRLEIESNRIRMKFASLVTTTALVIRKSENTSDDLKTFFTECGMKELANSIDAQDSVSLIMRRVHENKGWSFFDYELLEQIIKTFCRHEQEIMQDLKEYIMDFKNFCERRLYEVPREIFAMELLHVHSKAEVILKIDKEFLGEEEVKVKSLLGGEKIGKEELELSLNKIKKLQCRLAEVLGIEHLIFLDARIGCIELTFRHFKENNPILLLSTPDKITLALIGVKRIQCDTVSRDLQLYISPPPKFKNGSYVKVCK